MRGGGMRRGRRGWRSRTGDWGLDATIAATAVAPYEEVNVEQYI